MAAAVAEVSKGVRRIAAKADVENIDAWWRRAAGDILALVAAGFEVARQLGAIFLADHAAAEGRSVEPVLAEWNQERVETSLRVTGPVAFKGSILSGNTPAVGRVAMANTLAGSAERLTLTGERETVEATIEASAEIVGWRRVGDGNPCAFCAMLISRGAVYKSRATAGGRTNSGFVGDGLFKYHDNDGCTAVPLYEHEEEPDEVDDLYRQWREVTDRESGQGKVQAWRKYWDGRAAEASPDLEVEGQDELGLQLASERVAGTDIASVVDEDFDVLLSEAKRAPAVGDPLLSALMRRQPGWDTPGVVVAAEELDRLVASGWAEAWRGVVAAGGGSAADVAAATRTGRWDMGRGDYGNGVYLSARRTTAEVFRGHDPLGELDSYAGPGRYLGADGNYEWVGDGFAIPDDDPGRGGLLRIALDPAARLIDWHDLVAEHAAWLEQQGDMPPQWQRAANDSSWYALMRGYDGVIVRGEEDGAWYPADVTGSDNADQWIIFNRSVLVFEEAGDRYDA